MYIATHMRIHMYVCIMQLNRRSFPYLCIYKVAQELIKIRTYT